MAQSFLTQLGKVFIRSAVNQVGRDGGKIISNQIYANKNSINTMNVSNSNQIFTEIPEGTYIKNEQTLLKIISALFLSLIPFLGGIILIYRGVVNCRKKTRKLFKTEQQANYVQDRRYKTGTRFTGNSNIEAYVGELEDLEYQKENFKKGIFYIAIGIISIVFFIYRISVMK